MTPCPKCRHDMFLSLQGAHVYRGHLGDHAMPLSEEGWERFKHMNWYRTASLHPGRAKWICGLCTVVMPFEEDP